MCDNMIMEDKSRFKFARVVDVVSAYRLYYSNGYYKYGNIDSVFSFYLYATSLDKLKEYFISVITKRLKSTDDCIALQSFDISNVEAVFGPNGDVAIFKDNPVDQELSKNIRSSCMDEVLKIAAEEYSRRELTRRAEYDAEQRKEYERLRSVFESRS